MRQFRYSPSPLPLQLDLTLLDWLRREFEALRQAFLSVWDMPVSTAPPIRVSEGMLRYADGVLWDPGAGKGVYVYDGSAWVKL
jgi:hypothetical protein